MPGIGFDYLRQFELIESSLVLRRYMSHSKFIQSIESGTLYFAPASSFSDKFEGHYTKRDEALSDARLAQWRLDHKARLIASESRAIVAVHNQNAVVISCWTGERAENLRMWSEYANESEAVAVETTVGDLRRALGPSFLIICVRYLDFLRESIPKDHSLLPFFFKGRDYEWEQEVRIIGEMEIGKRIGTPRMVPVDLKVVLRRIVISPFAPAVYSRTITTLLSARSFSVPVQNSLLRTT